MPLKIIAGIFCASLLILVLELIRRNKLSFKYALSWIIVAILGLVFSIFDRALFAFSTLVGFELPSNFIFFSLLCALIMLSLLLTVFLCQQNNRNDQMAQKIGLLQEEVSHLKQRTKNTDVS